jgi:hypothetical protein
LGTDTATRFFAAAGATALAGCFAGVAGEAFLQRRDQVDHVAAVGRLPVFRLRILTLRLRLDHRPQPRLVAVLDVGWIVRAGLPLDQLYVARATISGSLSSFGRR